jgi:hypothetical protein
MGHSCVFYISHKLENFHLKVNKFVKPMWFIESHFIFVWKKRMTNGKQPFEHVIIGWTIKWQILKLYMH